MMIWDAREAGCAKAANAGLLDPHGAGLAFARLSSDEIQKGETIGFHIQSASETAKRAGLTPRFAVASLNNSGYQPFNLRQDLLFLESKIQSGEVAWLAVSYADRLARDRLPLEEIYEMLRSARVDLYVGTIDRKINWHGDDSLLAAWALTSSAEGRQIKERTHGAIIRRYLLEGRGWPASIRFGTKRGPDLYLVEDPEQMKIVRWLFARYLEMRDAGKGSLRQLKREAAEVWGANLSHERIRTILIDPLYVTGEWHVTYEGYAVACRPVAFTESVKAEDYQRVQEFLALRKAHNEETALGEFLLNYVPFYHAPCQGDLGQKGRPPLLRGFNVTKTQAYRHMGHTPAGCRRFRVLKEPVERALIGAIRQALQSKAVAEAFAESEAAAAPFASQRRSTEDADAAEYRRLEVKLAEVKTSLAAVKRQFFDGLTEGELEISDWKEMTADHRAERDRLERQIELLERPPTPRRKRNVISAADRDGYLTSVNKILTEETPTDPDHRIARAALVRALVSSVVLHEETGADRGDGDGAGDGESTFRLEVRGWIIPDHLGQDETVDPLESVKERLDNYAKGGMNAVAEDLVVDEKRVKQGEPCLTPSEARELVDFLSRHERPPAKFDRYRRDRRLARVKTSVVSRIGGKSAWQVSAPRLPIASSETTVSRAPQRSAR